MRMDCCYAPILVVSFSLAMAGCAGGGRGAGAPVTLARAASPQTPAPPTQPSVPTPPPTAAPDFYVPFFDTGSAGPVAAPAAAMWGNAAPQMANSSGATITGGPPFTPTNTIFPVLAAGLQFSPTGATPLPIGSDATATVMNVVPDPCVGADTSVQLKIPSANVNTTITLGPDFDHGLYNVNYVTLGLWRISGVEQSFPDGLLVLGYETPTSAVPKGGQAIYSGYTLGQVYAPIDGHVLGAWLDGKANLVADFASGKVTGALTAIQYDGGVTSNAHVRVSGPWNDVSVSAAIAAGSNRFSGAAAVTSAPANPYSLGPAASGHIDGAFFGPSAQQIGAIWTLSDGNVSAIGGIVAAH